MHVVVKTGPRKLSSKPDLSTYGLSVSYLGFTFLIWKQDINACLKRDRRNEMEQTCRISQGSEQEAEATLARKTEDRELCADKSFRSGGYSQSTRKWAPNDAGKNIGHQGPPPE